MREVANSISTLGFCAPILVGKENLVLDGAFRVQAARQPGLGRAPCVRIEHLSENDQRVLRLAINRLGEKGEWNLEELKIGVRGSTVRNRREIAAKCVTHRRPAPHRPVSRG